MSLLENKKNNSGIKQLNQISEFIEGQTVNNNNNIQKDSNENRSEEEEEEEEEDEEEEEGTEQEQDGTKYSDNNKNILEKENIEENEENEEEEEIEEGNLSLLSLYKYRLNYDDNLYLYPRPKTNFIKYKNSKSENIYISDSNNTEKRPSVMSYFTNIEESNSSIKLIRPSQYIIPNKINNFSNTLNLFGVNIEPFSLDDKQNSLEFIQKINIEINHKKNKNILRCKYCNAVYHKLNFDLESISENDYYIKYKYFCLICKRFDEIFSIKFSPDNNNTKVIDENKIFFIPDIEIKKPSIEYITKEENGNLIIREVIQIIILDLSNKDFVKFIYKEINNIMINIKEQYEKDNKNESRIKYVLIAYYYNKIFFMHLNKLNKTINVSIMGDLKDSFCPIEPIKLFCSIKEFLDLLGNFYNTFYSNKFEQIEKRTSINYFDINNSIIKSIFSLIKMNKINQDNNNCNKFYYHIIFFSSSNYDINLDLFKENKINNLFLSFFLISKFTDKNIPFMDNLNFHNIKLYYYPIDYESNDINQKYQEIKLILNKIINIQNYIFDIKLSICYDKKIFKNISNNDIINISFIPNKKSLNKIYILPQIGKPSLLTAIFIQYNIEYYTCIDKLRHIRVLTFMNKVSNDTKEIYQSFDEEILFRIVLANHIIELNLSKNNFNSINKLYTNIINKTDKIFSKIINNIIKKIKSTFAKDYKNGVEKKGVYFPLSPKLFPLYFFSFIKQISNGINLNLFNLIYDCKIKAFMKSIYPNLINIGFKSKSKKEIFSLHPLSIEFFDKTQLLLLDNGISISLLISENIRNRIKEHYLIENEKEDKNIKFKAESEVINDIIKNRPLKIVKLNDNIILNKKFLDIFLEDRFIKNINEEIENEPKFELDNEYIQNDISYSDFYRIISQNFYEFFE